MVTQCQRNKYKMRAITCANINNLKGIILTLPYMYIILFVYSTFFWLSININEILSVYAYFHMIC